MIARGRVDQPPKDYPHRWPIFTRILLAIRQTPLLQTDDDRGANVRIEAIREYQSQNRSEHSRTSIRGNCDLTLRFHEVNSNERLGDR